MDNNAKLRPLYLAKILYEMTDEDHTLSTNQLIELLKEKYGVGSYRTTIASDIELLRQYGMDIQSIKSQSIMYSMISREFDLPELKLLIGADTEDVPAFPRIRMRERIRVPLWAYELYRMVQAAYLCTRPEPSPPPTRSVICR